MRHPRLHCEAELREGAALRLGTEAAHYLGNVLRLRPGQRVHVFNASDGEFVACIEGLAKKCAELRIDSLLRSAGAPSLEIELCLGMTRGERMAYAIQKAVELGVSRITPFVSAFGEVRLARGRSAKRLEHWRRIAIAAVEQSGGLRVPAFSEPLPLDALLQDSIEPDRERLLFDPSGTVGLPQALADRRPQLITGPEGGFAEPELELAARCGCAIVALGPRILRAETAPVVALALVQHRFGDMARPVTG